MEEKRQTRAGLASHASGVATSSTRWPFQRPPEPRKVARPLSAEMPAPVRTKRRSLFERVRAMVVIVERWDNGCPGLRSVAWLELVKGCCCSRLYSVRWRLWRHDACSLDICVSRDV